MKFAPKSLMIFLCIPIFIWGCRYEENRLRSPKDDKNNELPEEQPLDSSELYRPALESAPDTTPANKAKKKSGSQLDTLRPIKA